MSAGNDIHAPTRRKQSPGHRSVGRANDEAAAPDADFKAGEAYRRQARHLRQRYAGQPELLHSSLRELSRRHDRTQRAVAASAMPAGARPLRLGVERARPLTEPDMPTFGRAVVNWFADRVAATVDSRMLQLSERHALLKTAERLGIDRFHANLIVAVAQHQAQERTAVRTMPAKARGWPTARLMLILIVQTLIVSAGWWALR